MPESRSASLCSVGFLAGTHGQEIGDIMAEENCTECEAPEEMPRYIGVKIIRAQPGPCPTGGMGNYKEGEDGYVVEYEDRYRSWSPKDVFYAAYRSTSGMTFGLATEAMRKGHKVSRSGWNGPGQFVVLMPALKLPPFSSQDPGAKVNDRTARHIGEDTPLDSQPYFSLFNAQGKWQPGWVPSTSDCLADDWQIAD